MANATQVNHANGSAQQPGAAVDRAVITRPALIPSFIEEARRLLGKIEGAVPKLEGPGSAEVLRSVLRSLHTLKGAVGLLGLAPMSGLAHDLETHLNSLGPGIESSRAVGDCVTLFRRLLTELEMAELEPPCVSAELLAQCEEFREGIIAAASHEGVPSEARLALPHEGRVAIRTGLLAVEATNRLFPEGLSQESAARPVTGRPASDLLRIEAGKLDRLLVLLHDWGEAHSALAAAARSGAAAPGTLYRDLSHLYESGEEVRRAGLALRLTGLQRSFQKIEWLVGDLAPRLGKRVDLELHGADVELDVATVQELDTILLHLVRNALEHGLEKPDQRENAGKSPRGALRLAAFGFEEAVVVEVIDDGRGFDRDAILQQAAARNLLPVGAHPSDAELLKLAFSPGFSTARSVTETSGRGLGLDIVRRTVEKLDGVIEVNSDFGLGTTFQVYLPCAGGQVKEEDRGALDSRLRGMVEGIGKNQRSFSP